TGRPNRDVVLIIDGSYSMGYTGSGQSAHDAAREWANAFLRELAPGDTVAGLQAKQQGGPGVGEVTSDLGLGRGKNGAPPAPGGGCDWPLAVQTAHKLLARSQRPQREIVLLGDGQRFGWADDTTLLRWELLANQLRESSALQPRLWYVNLDPDRPA